MERGFANATTAEILMLYRHVKRSDSMEQRFGSKPNGRATVIGALCPDLQHHKYREGCMVGIEINEGEKSETKDTRADDKIRWSPTRKHMHTPTHTITTIHSAHTYMFTRTRTHTSTHTCTER